jgi:HAE1 family hydrophobic/amphiphilic exporter-1
MGSRLWIQEGPQQKDELARATVEVSNAIASLNGLLAEESLLNAQEQAFVQEKTALKQVVDLDTMLSQVFPNGVSALSSEEFTAVMNQLASSLPPELAGNDTGSDRADQQPGRYCCKQASCDRN